MSKEAAESFSVRYVAIATKLEALQSVRNLDRGEDRQAWTIAPGLLDIADSALIFARLLGELETAQSANDLEDLLHGIGEELRHIEYHIRDMAYFDYVLPVADSDACPPPTDD